MAKIKKNFYVVWKGTTPGIYNNWTECEKNVKGVAGAKFKGYFTLEEAEKAFADGYQEDIIKQPVVKESLIDGILPSPDPNALSVDAACSNAIGPMEYQGVWVGSKRLVFHVGTFEQGTNNIGEFLALVHGLAFLKQHNLNCAIYSDSRNAIKWVHEKKCGTTLMPNNENRRVFELIAHAEQWLKSNNYESPILKWETKAWGEIPADFGRK